MKLDFGKPQNVTAPIAERRLRSELESLGFLSTKEPPSAAAQRMVSELKSHGVALPTARSLKLVRKINEQSEVFIYPGVRKKGAGILVDPVIGLENTILRERLVAIGWDGSTSVCHVYLGLKASWGQFPVQTEPELDRAASEFIKAVVEVGLPMMREFDTLDKVRQLFRNDLDATKQVNVAVLFAEEKLKVIEGH